MKLSSISAQARINFTFELDSTRSEFTNRAVIKDKQRIVSGTTNLRLQRQQCVDVTFYVEVGCWTGLSHREIHLFGCVTDTWNISKTPSSLCRPVLKMLWMNLPMSSISPLRVCLPSQISGPASLRRHRQHPFILYVFSCFTQIPHMQKKRKIKNCALPKFILIFKICMKQKVH